MGCPSQGGEDPIVRLPSTIRLAIDDLLDQPRHLLLLRTTLLLLLLHGAHSWALDVPLRILCGISIICLPLTTSPVVWLAISIVVACVNAATWYSIDNHKYLILYWCFVCLLAVSAKNPGQVLAFNARMLIALCFLFATGWKFLGNEYLDGSFLHFTFLTDPRVEGASMVMGGLGPEILAENRELLAAIKSAPDEDLRVTLGTSAQLRLATVAMSYWTLAIEGAIGIVFLLSRPRWICVWRDYLLMIFVVSTYLLLPVAGFAFALALLGLAQCPVERRKTRIAYLVLFVVVQMVPVPWDSFLAWLAPSSTA